jgi:hypothetical protein
MRHSDLVATVIVLVGLLAGTAGYYAGASSRPVDRRIAALEARALTALAVAVVVVVAAGVAVAALAAR